MSLQPSPELKNAYFLGNLWFFSYFQRDMSFFAFQNPSYSTKSEENSLWNNFCLLE